MKFTQYVLPVAVLGTTALFFGASNLSAYTFDGNILSLNERDFRVFNNFTDANANNNTVPSPNYLGSLGAVQALWKGTAEWDSEPVGSGTGDPTQAQLGSGGANFDAYFAGLATSSGVIGQNIMSELAGSNGGVLAFTELPGSPGGWRILYYSTWDWHDGPSFIGGGGSSFDLQGITTHEYGHALGLGHSASAGATMEASAAAVDVSLRSIEADDIAGVQALYGVKSASKLHTTSFIGNGKPIRITGTNFPAMNNEVWFTSKLPTAAATVLPIKVTGLLSTGTTIDVNVPATAGLGSLHVRDGNAFAYLALSNPLNYDPSLCPPATPYCVGKLNSAGFVPSITFSGSNSLIISGGTITIECNDGVPNKPGLFLSSDNGPAATPFQGGTLCLAPPIVRSPPFVFDIFGYASRPVTFGAFEVGSYRYFQAWSRDPQAPGGIPVGLSNASELKFCP